MSEQVEELIDAEKYVAFCDILGFSSKVSRDFQGTVEAYRRFAERLDDLAQHDVTLTMYSDSMLLTADELAPLLQSIQTIWFVALSEDLMLRGGVAKGRYWQHRKGNHMLVASDALVSAVKLEAMVGVPAVVLADNIDVPLDFWVTRFAQGPYVTPLLHFRDRNIVNPFNLIWGESAANRCRQLLAESPQHKEKYLWFLALYEAVRSNAQLVPQAAYQEMLEKGILRWVPPSPDADNVPVTAP